MAVVALHPADQYSAFYHSEHFPGKCIGIKCFFKLPVFYAVPNDPAIRFWEELMASFTLFLITGLVSSASVPKFKMGIRHYCFW